MHISVFAPLWPQNLKTQVILLPPKATWAFLYDLFCISWKMDWEIETILTDMCILFIFTAICMPLKLLQQHSLIRHSGSSQASLSNKKNLVWDAPLVPKWANDSFSQLRNLGLPVSLMRSISLKRDIRMYMQSMIILYHTTICVKFEERLICVVL